MGSEEGGDGGLGLREDSRVQQTGRGIGTQAGVGAGTLGIIFVLSLRVPSVSPLLFTMGQDRESLPS